MPAGLAFLKSYLAVYLQCQNFVRLDAFHLCYWTKQSRKLEIRSQKCILVANVDRGNYRLLDLRTRKVHVSMHVTFIEDKFPARALSGQSENVMHIPTFFQR
jgi:hypothetical protein